MSAGVGLLSQLGWVSSGGDEMVVVVAGSALSGADLGFGLGTRQRMCAGGLGFAV
jgi:hypothetical protein